MISTNNIFSALRVHFYVHVLFLLVPCYDSSSAPVSQCPDFLSSFSASSFSLQTHKKSANIGSSAKIQLQVLEQDNCNVIYPQSRPQHFVGCVRRCQSRTDATLSSHNSISQRPLVHILLISSHSVSNHHPVNLRVDYHDPRRPLVLVLATTDVKLFYVDLLSVLANTRKDDRRQIHRIIMLGAASRVSFEQWSAQELVRVEYLTGNSSSWAALLDSKDVPPSNEQLRRVARALWHDIRRGSSPLIGDSRNNPESQLDMGREMDHWVASILWTWCNRHQIIVRPWTQTTIRGTNCSNEGLHTIPVLACDPVAQSELNSIYEGTMVASASDSLAELVCSGSFSTTTTSEEDPAVPQHSLLRLLYLQLPGWTAHPLATRREHSLELHSAFLTQEEEQLKSLKEILLLDLDSEEEDEEQHQVEVLVDVHNVFRPLEIHTTTRLKFQPPLNLMPVEIRILEHTTVKEMEEYFNNLQSTKSKEVRWQYFHLPPPASVHLANNAQLKVFFRWSIRFTERSTTLSMELQRHSSTTCRLDSPMTVAVRLDLSNSCAFMKSLLPRLPSDNWRPVSLFPSPEMTVRLGGMNAECRVPHRLAEKVWYLAEDNLELTPHKRGVCGWHQDHTNILVLQDARMSAEPYMYEVACPVDCVDEPELSNEPTEKCLPHESKSSALLPVFSTEVFLTPNFSTPALRTTAHNAQLLVSQVSNRAPSPGVLGTEQIHFGDTLYARLLMDSTDSMLDLLQFEVSTCRLVYQASPATQSLDLPEVTFSAYRELFNQSCLSSHLHFLSVPRDGGVERRFYFHYLQPPDELERNVSRWTADTGVIMRVRVLLQCHILPCWHNANIQHLRNNNSARALWDLYSLCAPSQTMNTQQCFESTQPPPIPGSRTSTIFLQSYATGPLESLSSLHPSSRSTDVWCRGPHCGLFLALLVLCVLLLLILFLVLGRFYRIASNSGSASPLMESVALTGVQDPPVVTMMRSTQPLLCSNLVEIDTVRGLPDGGQGDGGEARIGLLPPVVTVRGRISHLGGVRLPSPVQLAAGDV